MPSTSFKIYPKNEKSGLTKKRQKTFLIIVNHKNEYYNKYLVNACGMRDGQSGDMWALSQCNLVAL